ncbi:MAG: GTP cyclohydrolase I FolE2 [Proteobacteria bacterium]|uniref:GTP cyclohydrolase FolE2 n=1 Tax=Aquabacterium sp. TaxID=1872578 RepID=UPI0035C73BE4|nr:GTP cyclohydrolase I FolE2 [Pseudomonadota bacterium]
MNAPEILPLVDIQSQTDTRNLPIQAVGIKEVRYPVRLRAGQGPQARTVETAARWTMSVGLAATVKGTHMSRFIELLEAPREALDLDGFARMTAEMLQRLEAHSGRIEMHFPYFLRKAAPVSGVESLLDIDATWRCHIPAIGARPELSMRLTVAATSLCPCSKEISAYGAHNQRSHITLDVALREALSIEALARIAEDSASCAVYGLLKRVDEKHVTERAYDNPKFVEDLVRDVALALSAEPRVRAYQVEVENFESIHNHSAFATIGGSRDD